MDPREIHIDGQLWHLHIYGRGPRLLIAFHGFGQEGSVFSSWAPILGADYTIVAPDLPFHGAAVGWNKNDFRPRQLIPFIQGLPKEFDCPDFMLVGHSLGARIISSVFSQLSHPPSTIWLLAPDGFATRRLALVNALPAWVRALVDKGIERWHDQWVNLARSLQGWGWIDGFSAGYLKHHLSDSFRRQRLMGTWRSIPHFPVDKEKLLEAAIQQHPPINLVISEKDKLIDWESLREWLKTWPEENLHRVAAGHRLIREETAQLILADVRRSYEKRN